MASGTTTEKKVTLTVTQEEAWEIWFALFCKANELHIRGLNAYGDYIREIEKKIRQEANIGH